MHPRHDLLRALARHLTPLRDFSAAVPDDATAAAAFLCAIHRDRCPACESPSIKLAGPREIRCASCRRRRSLTATTPLRGTRISLRHWLAAVWHVLVDTEAISARAFARRHGLRAQTAWQLLHDVRAAIPYVRPRTPGATAQILGRQSPANTAFVNLACDGGELTAVMANDGVPQLEPIEPAVSLWLGRLRAWLCDVYRGVSRRYLSLYLAELTSRYGRLSASRGWRAVTGPAAPPSSSPPAPSPG